MRQETSEEFYEVEKIITNKVVDGKKYYLIKWEGFGLGQSSWEPISHLTNVLDMVEKFESNYPNSIDQVSFRRILKLSKKFEREKKARERKALKRLIEKKKNLGNNKIIIDLNCLFQKENSDFSEKNVDKLCLNNGGDDDLKKNNNDNNNNISINIDNIIEDKKKEVKLIKPIMAEWLIMC